MYNSYNYFYLFSNENIRNDKNINKVIDDVECAALGESQVYTELDFLIKDFEGSRKDIKKFEIFVRNNINLNYCCNNFDEYLKTSKRELYTHTILDFTIEKFKLLRKNNIVTSIKLKQIIKRLKKNGAKKIKQLYSESRFFIELIKLKEAKIKIEKRFEDMKNNPVEIEL
jgi:hypothetical protein